MRISIAICTWNRCELLRQTLEQMTKLVAPAGVPWEVLVVNNNSTDATDRVIAAFEDRLPLRRLFEPRAGKSNACNLAVREATGDYILWTDDDVLVDEQWMVEYCRAFERRPNAAVFGGFVDPWFEGTPPSWLRRVFPKVANAYAARDVGREPTPITQEAVPYGANMALRAKEQARNLYDPMLGPRPSGALPGEETTLIRAMLKAGAEGWWVPTARVRHYIPAHRQTTRYLRGFYRRYGEFLGRPISDAEKRHFLGRPWWLWREWIEEELKYQTRRRLARPEVWIDDLRASSIAWGRLRYYGAGDRT